MNRKLWKSCIAAAFFGLVLSVVPAIADEFPAKPVKLVIPWGAGGGMDTMDRVLEPVVTKCLGQPLSYVYKPGAGSAIGTAEVAKAPADGYTMSLNLYPQQAINVHLGVAAYAVNDLIPVCMIATDPTILSVVKGSKFKTWEELVAAAKEKPNSVIVGTSDRSGPAHASALLMREAGIPVNVVPFATGGPTCISALLGGQIDAMFSPVLTVYSTVRDKTDLLVYADKQRSSLLPDVKTTTEAGYPDIQGFSGRFFWVPKGTPEEVLKKLSDAFQQACADPDTQKRLLELGLTVDFLDYKQAAAFLKDMEPNLERTVAVFKQAGK